MAIANSDTSSSDGADITQTELSKGFENVKVSAPFNPFPEAVQIDPILAGRRQATFDNDSLGDYYQPIETYEGRHRWDPKFEWEPKEEQRLVRKIDWKICTYACLMFFALQLDRGNMLQAVSDGMLDDLGVNTNAYDLGQTIFYICFLCAELPSQLVSKKLGVDRWIPCQMVAWSLVACCQSLMKNKTGFFICRGLLGILEGGFIPDVILYLSYFYTSTELPRRLSFFWVAYQSTNIVAALLGYGILHLGGKSGLYGWQWLFALEGIVTGLIGIFSWFYLPPSPTQTKSALRPNGWFDEREEKIMVNRILRDDPSKGDMHNRQGLSWSAFKLCISDYHMWPLYLIGITWLVPTVPMQGYLTLQIEDAGFGTFDANLLCIPAFTLFIIGLLFWTWLSEKLNERFLLATCSQLWMIPCLTALLTLPIPRSPWVAWALCSLIFAMPYFHAVFVSLASRNAGSVRTRTVASALYNMAVQSGSIIGINIYRTPDAPYYFTGNKVLISLCVYNIVIMVGAKIFYVTVNKRREAVWSGMSKEEKEHYLQTTTDKGNKRLDFRFAH